MTAFQISKIKGVQNLGFYINSVILVTLHVPHTLVVFVVCI